jgi:hypothetical protein
MARRQSYASYVAYEKRMKPYMDEGLAHAKAGGDIAGIDRYFSPDQRSAWLVGWQNGGGDITRRVVVTQRQRWEERRVALLKELTELDERLADTSGEKHGD